MTEWRPSANQTAMRLRATVCNRIREFFAQREVLEVSTPVLTSAGVTDVHIASIPASLNGSDTRYLRSSPEFFHKRLLAAGSGDIYELGPVFRDAECGQRHNPEFTMLEWYRVAWPYTRLMEEVVALIRYAANGRFDDWPVHHVTWQDAFLAATGIDPHTADTAALAATVQDAPDGLQRPELLDWLFATRVQQGFTPHSITLVRDFPATQAALARIRPGNPPVAERFELFLGPMELANGYQELTDPHEQRRRFAQDNRHRVLAGKPAMPIDTRFLAALDAGLPECSGVAMGLDRLLMTLQTGSAIGQVLTFRETGHDNLI